MERLMIVLFASCVVAMSAQKVAFGACPNAIPLSQLNLTSYLGKWHEIYRINNVFEIEQSCVTANYSVKADGHVKVDNQGVSDGQLKTSIGDAYIADATKPAELSVQFNSAPYAPYWVLDTDYTNYTVVFSCEALSGLVHAEFVWILSRNTTISDSLQQRLFQKLESNGVSTSPLVKTVQTNCPKTKTK